MAKRVYMAEDGKEFPNEADAEAHDLLLAAKSDYYAARRVYAMMLAENNKTADGVKFALTTYHEYFYIIRSYNSSPELRSVNFYIWNCDLDDSDSAVIVQYEPRRDNSQVRIEYRISNLYYHRRNADVAFRHALKEWLVDMIQTAKDKGVELMPVDLNAPVEIIAEDSGRNEGVLRGDLE